MSRLMEDVTDKQAIAQVASKLTGGYVSLA